MGRKIIDEFSNLPVSHQRKAQLRALKRGLCSACFKRRLYLGERCKGCYAKLLKGSAAYRRRNHRRQLLLMKRWRAANPNYGREYYQKKKAAVRISKPPSGGVLFLIRTTPGKYPQSHAQHHQDKD